MGKVIPYVLAAFLTTVAARAEDVPGQQDPGYAALNQFLCGETAGLQSLYEDRFGASGAGTGNFEIVIVVGKEGAVDQVIIQQDTVADEDFAEALREYVRAWRLPAPTWGGTWKLPLEFNPAEGTYGVAGP